MKPSISGIITIILLLVNLNLFAQCLEGDCIDGYGILECDCGYVFEGEFKGGEKVKGTLTKKDLVYTGDFKNDVAHGQGKICYKDGSCYEGSFVNNEFSGFGMYSVVHKFTYVGEFEHGNYQGLGIKFQINKKGDTTSFEYGEFENDQFHGVGVRSYKNGGFEFLEVGEEVNKGFAWKPVQGDSSFIMALYYNPVNKEGVVFDSNNTAYTTSDSVRYRVFGYNQFPQMYLEIQKDGIIKYYYTDSSAGVYFVSGIENPFIGKVITTNGEIFEASLSVTDEFNLIIKDQLYKP